MDRRERPRDDESVIEMRFDLIVAHGGSVVEASAAHETRGSADTLSGVLAHLAGARAAAEYRILVTASQLHDECEEEYLVAVAEHRGDQPCSAEQLAADCAAARTGADPFEKYGPDGTERAVAHLGASLNVTPYAARRLIEVGHALRRRLPRTGALLACGRIDRPRFDAVVAHTDLVADEMIGAVDEALAAELVDRPAMAFPRFTALVDHVIARIDPEAVELRAERVSRDRAVSVRPDRRVPGQSRIAGRLGAVDGARLDAALDALADSVHHDDPRTRAQLRVDALLAMTRGETLPCGCAVCVAGRAAEPAAPAPLPDGVPLAHAWFHIVVNLSTLIGLDDDPAYCDGQGLLDANTVRGLLAEAERSFVHTAAAGRSGHTYQASPRLADLIRCGELWCSFPGCDRRAWSSDLDHADEFDHAAPASGGPTARSNLVPLCRLHHRIKTFTDWRDYLDRQGMTLFVSPAGRLTVGSGFAGHDLFPALRPGETGPPGTGPACLRDRPGRERARLRRLRERRESGEDPPPY